MRIGFDLMGSDARPQNEIQALRLLKDEIKCDLVVIGKGDQEAEVKGLGYDFRLADEFVDMHETPTIAVRQKQNSSLGILFKMLKQKEIDALVSAGNTGAMMGFSMLTLGGIETIARAGLAITFPTETGYSVLIDVGANIKPKPEDFLNYGIMGSVFAAIIFNKENPRIAILNIGTESVKGDEVRQKAYQVLKDSAINFIGNIEGNDIMKGFADVVVTDGFTGNVVLKLTEGIVGTIWSMLKETVDGARRGRFGQFLVRPAMEDLKAKFSYEEYGGGILLGVDGVVIICHGRSSPMALKNAIKMAKTCVESNIIDEIKKRTIK